MKTINVDKLLEWIEKTSAFYTNAHDSETDRAYGNGMLEVKKFILSHSTEQPEGEVTDVNFNLLIRENEHEVMDELACEELSQKCFALAQQMVSKAVAGMYTAEQYEKLDTYASQITEELDKLKSQEQKGFSWEDMRMAFTRGKFEGVNMTMIEADDYLQSLNQPT